MRSLFIITIGSLLSFFAKAQSSSIYSFQINSLTGQSGINFSSFQGKKILIVNTASEDSSFKQYQELLQLDQLYKDSLVIVIVPSNSFSTESRNNLQLSSVYLQNPSNEFKVAAKLNVKGEGIHPLFKWLTSSSENGRMDSRISRPFFKYLINRNGQLIGVFGPRISPMNPILRKSIESNN